MEQSDKFHKKQGVCEEITPHLTNECVYNSFSRLPKDMWFMIFRKIGMKNTKNMYISCKWLYNYITNNEYFNFLMEHKMMKLFHMFINNMSFTCGKNDQGKNNQMCIYNYGKNIESHFAEYILNKITTEYIQTLHMTRTQAMKANLPNLTSDFIFCEYCDRYHDTITDKITQNQRKIILCNKCKVVTCKWNISKVTSSLNIPGGAVNNARIEMYGKTYCKTYASDFCDDCIDWSQCDCGTQIEDSTKLYCSTKQCYKLECNSWKCYKCIKQEFTPCKCCGLSVCQNCLTETDFAFRKVEKGIPTPVGSNVCKYCISTKIKKCMKCNEHAITNLLWKCKHCTEYYHKSCFDVRTKCSLCKKGQKMPYEHVRKCGGNICENCFEQAIICKKQICSKCSSFFEPNNCLLCERGINSHNKNECLEKRKSHCVNCLV